MLLVEAILPDDMLEPTLNVLAGLVDHLLV